MNIFFLKIISFVFIFSASCLHYECFPADITKTIKVKRDDIPWVILPAAEQDI